MSSHPRREPARRPFAHAARERLGSGFEKANASAPIRALRARLSHTPSSHFGVAATLPFARISSSRPLPASSGVDSGDDPVRRRKSRGAVADGDAPDDACASGGSSLRGAVHAPASGDDSALRYVSASDAPGADDGSDASAEEESDNRPILISSIDFEGESPELEQVARRVVLIKPNFSYTVKEIKQDVVRVFNTGIFKEVTPETVDTRDGISLTFKLVANPVIRGLVIKGCNELPANFCQDLFRHQFGKVLNSNYVVAACHEISKWYDHRKMPVEWYGVQVDDGIMEIGVEEPRIGEVEIRFLDRKTGEPCEGNTRPEMITRHLKNVKPGKALHGRVLDDLNDLITTAGLENANIAWNPRRSTFNKPGQFLVDTTINVTEKQTAGFSGGGGISAKGLQEGGWNALIANADYFRRNLFGRCQSLTARVEISPNNLSSKPEIDVKLQHSDPWIGDASRTSRRVFLDSDSASLEAVAARTPVASGAADGGVSGDDAGVNPNGLSAGLSGGNDANEALGAEDGPRGIFVKRVTSGVEWRRPLAACWTGTLSATYQRAATHDDLKRECLTDAYGSPLTFSGLGHDTTLNALMRFVYEGRGRDEAQLVVSAEQAFPVLPGMLSFNRILVRAQRTFALAKGSRVTVAAKGGNVIGDLPPYEAFSIGGASSVRGYPEGGVGTGRKFIAGSAELAVPIVPESINGCVFIDVGSDLKSGVSVLGDPGGTRGKPGQGYGYGAGVIALTPIGPVRLEYAFSDKGLGRMHCGLSRNF